MKFCGLLKKKKKKQSEAQMSVCYQVSEIGPYALWSGDAGAVSWILAHPTNANIIWVATVNGGIWKTTNGGTNWVSLTDFKVPSMSVSHISFDPTDASLNTIIASIGNPSNGQWTAGNFVGVYYTTNGGTTWTLPSGYNTFQNNAVRVRRSYKIGSKIISCIFDRTGTVISPFYISTNLGVTWTQTGTAWQRCMDMIYIHSTTTVIGALTGKFLTSST